MSVLPDLSGFSKSELDLLAKNITAEKDRQKKEKNTRKKFKQKEYGDYFAATYKYTKLNDLFDIKIDAKNKIKVKYKEAREGKVYNRNYMDVINNLIVITHIAEELGLETEGFSTRDNIYWLEVERDYREVGLRIGIDIKKSKTLFELTDREYDQHEFYCADLSDPNFATKMKKDIAIKEKALKNLNKLQDEFVQNIDRLAKMKI